MRVPRGFSDEVRQQADIVRVVSDYVSLKKKGTNYWACCPFHQEKTPSFSVNASKQFFKCFGCGKAGDVFTFVMEIESCPFPEAVATVAEKTGIPIPVADNARDYEESDRRRAELMQLNQWATEFFEQNLMGSAEGKRALDYLSQRGIAEATRQAFRLGYAPNSWDALGNFLKAKGASRAQIETSGLVSVKDNGSGFYDRFRGRLMFPISDTQGRVIAFGGRILGEGEPKYLNSPETAVYTKGQHLYGLHQAREAIRQRGFVILVEGYLDFLVPFQAGVKNLVASLGTALTDFQVKLLGRYVRQIVVNFDPDSAGVAATKRSLEVLLANGFKVNVLTLPDNLDPDEFIRKHGSDGYLKLLKTSHRFLDYIVEQAVKTKDPSTPAGKVETINEILPYLKLVRDRIERAEYVERIADRLKIDSKLIREEFKKAVETRQEKVSERIKTATLSVKPAEKKLLELLLTDEIVRREMLPQLTGEDYHGLRTGRLFEVLIEMDRQGAELTWNYLNQALDDPDLARNLLPQLFSGPESRIAADGESEFPDEDSFPRAEDPRARRRREARESLHGLRCDRLAERQVALQMEINQAQRVNDQQALQDLLARKMDLAKQEKELAKWNSQ